MSQTTTAIFQCFLLFCSFAAVESGKPIHVPRVANHGNIQFWNPYRQPEVKGQQCDFCYQNLCATIITIILILILIQLRKECEIVLLLKYVLIIFNLNGI